MRQDTLRPGEVRQGKVRLVEAILYKLVIGLTRLAWR
jgi:hypothetical protein